VHFSKIRAHDDTLTHTRTHTLTHTHTQRERERKKEQRKTTMSAGNECSIFKTAAVFVLRKEKRLMSSREICMFALANDLLGEKERRVVPEKSMQKTLIVDAEQEEENARLFVRRTVDEQSFFGLREWLNDPTLQYLVTLKGINEDKEREVIEKEDVEGDGVPTAAAAAGGGGGGAAAAAAPRKKKAGPIVLPIWPTDPLLDKERGSKKWEVRKVGFRGKQKLPTKAEYKTYSEELSEAIARVQERLENIDSRLHRLETLLVNNMFNFGQSLDKIGELIEPFLEAGGGRKRNRKEDDDDDDDDDDD